MYENILEESGFTYDKIKTFLIISLFFFSITIFHTFNVTFSSCVGDTEPRDVFKDLRGTFALLSHNFSTCHPKRGLKDYFLAFLPTREESEMVGHFCAFIFI